MMGFHTKVWRGHGSFSLDKVLSTGRVKAPRLDDLPLTGEIHATAHINTLDEGDGGMVCFTPSEKFAYLYALKECGADKETIAEAFDRTFPDQPSLGNLRSFFLERNFMVPDNRAAIADDRRMNRWRVRKNEAILSQTADSGKKEMIKMRLRTLKLRGVILDQLLKKIDEEAKVTQELQAIRRQYPALLAFDGLPSLSPVQLRLLPGHAPDLELGHKGDVAVQPHLKEVHVPNHEIDNVRRRISDCGLTEVTVQPLSQFAA